MQKKIFISLLMIVFSSITACTQSPDCFREEVFCAAMVTDTRGINDYGVNQDTWAGLIQTKDDGVINQIDYIESLDARDYEKNISFFMDAGYDVVVTSGIGLRDATLRSADLHPDTIFIGMNQVEEEPLPNFISVTFPEDQMGFLAGVLAAGLTRTNKVGGVCETSGIDSMWRYCEGFRAGANYTNDSVHVFVVYRDGGSNDSLFNDEVWGAESAQELIKGGADVIFAAGGETGAGALRAAGKVKVPAIGAERDQGAALAEEGSIVVASIFGRASFTIQDVMRRVRDGNLADAGMSPIGYIVSDSVVPNNLAADMDELLAGLASGEIKTDVPDEKP